MRALEPFHSFRYLFEHAFRFTEREGENKDRFARTLGDVAGRRVTYDDHMGKQAYY
jgi:hypothetical protein